MSTKPSFKNLICWQKSYTLCINIYKLTKKFPNSELFGITSQLRRASVSVCSNIAEGFGRRTLKDKQNFYYTAKASLLEVENLVLISQGVNLINEIELSNILNDISDCDRLLQGLINKNKSKINIQ